MRPLSVLPLLLTLGCWGGEKPVEKKDPPPEAPKAEAGLKVQRVPGMDLSRKTMNVADDPEICATANTFLDLKQPALTPMRPLLDAPDRDAAFIGALLGPHMGDKPFRVAAFPMVTVLPIALDWKGRRAELKTKFEAAITALPPEKAALAHENYATLLLYMGEFQHLIDRYNADSADGKPFAGNGGVRFALGQALHRLGKYNEAIPHAKAAFTLLKESQLDTRWLLMLTEVAAYGWDFYEKYSKDAYDAKHIRALFPNDDWGKLPFEDVSDQMGFSLWGGYGGANWVDLDNDGWDDLMFEHKFKPPQLLKNVNGQKLENQPQKGNPLEDCGLVVWSPADVDNDGDRDIFRHCCNYDGWGPAVIAKNEGGFKFTDASKAAGLDNGAASGSFNAWSDYDLDGNLDVVITDAYGPTRLYRGKGGGQFEEVTAKAGVDTVKKNDPSFPGPPVFGGIGTSFGDFDDDGWPDLFVQGWDWKKLYRNKHDGTFEDVGVAAGIGDGSGARGYSAFFFDHDNDGKLDIFAGQYVVSSDEKWGFGPFCTCSNLLAPEGYSEREYVGASTIFRNVGGGKFESTNAKTKFIPFGTMSTSYADWDNDGDLDVVMGAGGPYFQQAEPFLFYQNNGDGTFTNLTPFLMQRLWGKGHGIAFNDYDHDGDLDVAMVNGSVVPGDLWPGLFLKNKGNDNHWLEVGLVGGPGTNRDAIGAQVRVTAGGKTYVREVASGGQFSTTHGFRVHFGLAKADKVEKVEIRWPNKELTVTTLTDVPIDAAVEVTQADGKWKKLWGKGG
jgi:hypothetical protein